MKCRSCGSERLEKRGSRRCYATLIDGDVDGWEEGDDIEWDVDSRYREIIYCEDCDTEQVLDTGTVPGAIITALVEPDYSTGPHADAAALDAITETMSGTEWSPDTLEDVAERVRESGRLIADYEGGS
jgi:hypothetical protein